MGYPLLLHNLGFAEDPFAKSNADEESNLESYFVPPPFFDAVFGNYHDPRSVIVFAPRGGGKTALKRKIELASETESFLCVTYNVFPVDSLTLSQINLAYHLKNVARLLLVAIVTATMDKGLLKLNKEDRHLLYLLVKEYLSEISQGELKDAIGAIKNLPDRAVEIWNKFTGPIGIVINALLQKIGLQAAEVSQFANAGGKLGDLRDQITVMQTIAAKLGYESIYILVDRVDEMPLTTSADRTYQFIQHLLTDLNILELPYFAFKFFLWNLVLHDYRSIARPDRVKYYELEWSLPQLEEMLLRRLVAYSDGKVRSLDDIADINLPISLHRAVATFAQGSPRTLVRICKQLFDQQAEIDSSAKQLSPDAVRKGFARIARDISSELFDKAVLQDLQRLQRADFTINMFTLKYSKSPNKPDLQR